MDALRKIVIILLLIALMTSLLYLLFAYFMWNMMWIVIAEVFTRFMFIAAWFIAFFCIIGLYDDL